MWHLVLIQCLSPFHLQKYSPLAGSYIKKNTLLCMNVMTTSLMKLVYFTSVVHKKNNCNKRYSLEATRIICTSNFRVQDMVLLLVNVPVEGCLSCTKHFPLKAMTLFFLSLFDACSFLGTLQLLVLSLSFLQNNLSASIEVYQHTWLPPLRSLAAGFPCIDSHLQQGCSFAPFLTFFSKGVHWQVNQNSFSRRVEKILS